MTPANTYLIDPSTAIIDAGVSASVITQNQGVRSLLDFSADRISPFDQWTKRGLCGTGAFPKGLRVALCRLGDDPGYSGQHRGDLVLAAMLLDGGRLTPLELQRAICDLQLARREGFEGRLEDYLALKNIFPLEKSQHLLGTTTFPSWLPIVRRDRRERRKADLGPPPGIPERRRAKRRSVAPKSSQLWVWVTCAAAAVALLFVLRPSPKPYVVAPQPEKPPVNSVEVVKPFVETVPAKTAVAPKGLPRDLLEVPGKVQALLSSTGGPAAAGAFQKAEDLLRDAMKELEGYDTPEGRALRGECQALLHLVLKTKPQ